MLLKKMSLLLHPHFFKSWCGTIAILLTAVLLSNAPPVEAAFPFFQKEQFNKKTPSKRIEPSQDGRSQLTSGNESQRFLQENSALMEATAFETQKSGGLVGPFLLKSAVLDRGTNWVRVSARMSNGEESGSVFFVYYDMGERMEVPMHLDLRSNEFRATVRDLKSNMDYPYQIQAMDETGELLFQSSIFHVKTEARISNINVFSIGAESADIQFQVQDLNPEESLTLQFRGIAHEFHWQNLNAVEGNVDPNSITLHLTKLKPDTLYLYRIVIGDEKNQGEESVTNQFRTLSLLDHITHEILSPTEVRVTAHIEKGRKEQRLLLEYRPSRQSSDKTVWKRSQMTQEEPDRFEGTLRDLPAGSAILYRVRVLEQNRLVTESNLHQMEPLS